MFCLWFQKLTRMASGGSLRAGADSQAGSILVLWPQVRLSFPHLSNMDTSLCLGCCKQSTGSGLGQLSRELAKWKLRTLTLLLNNIKSCIRRVAVLIMGPGFGFLEQSCSSISAAGEGTPFPPPPPRCWVVTHSTSKGRGWETT